MLITELQLNHCELKEREPDGYMKKPEPNVNSTKALLKSRVSEADQHNTQKHSKYEYGDGSNQFGFCVA